ncbi:hypothetical protein PUN28_010682 [Cardiocondyla obscurior]|uniref:Uncharacterized protein n=1 Tax=Cardiocondyla obscurior TaxID=286306 RepID=A0AAW2FKW2_9HYME
MAIRLPKKLVFFSENIFLFYKVNCATELTFNERRYYRETESAAPMVDVERGSLRVSLARRRGRENRGITSCAFAGNGERETCSKNAGRACFRKTLLERCLLPTARIDPSRL